MKYIIIWWPAIGISFLRNIVASFFLGKPGAFADWIFGRSCNWSHGMTCGSGIIVSGAFLVCALLFIAMVALSFTSSPQETGSDR